MRNADDADLARALGALLRLPTATPHASLEQIVPVSSANPGSVPGVAASSGSGAPSMARRLASGALLVGADAPGGSDLWATDPVLDGPLAAHLTGREGTDSEEEAAARAATALQESGFGGALHTALGELRRVFDDSAPVYADGAMASSDSLPEDSGFLPGYETTPGSTWPTSAPMSARYGGRPSQWLAGLSDWWHARWRDLLPGMVVATLIVVAFAVVLVSGGRRADDKSQVNTRREIVSDPSTTIPGLFTTDPNISAEAPPALDIPDTSGGSGSTSDASSTEAPAKASSDSSNRPTAPATTAKPSQPTSVSPPADPASPPDVNPPPVDPPPVNPPPVDPPPDNPPPVDPPPDNPPPDDDPPPPPPDICAIRPTRC